jgi:hypothetical protein
MPSQDSYYRRLAELVSGTRHALPAPHQPRPPASRPPLLRWTRRIAILLVCLWALLYAADTARLRLIAESGRRSTVSIDVYYAIHKKGGKTEFTYAGTEAAPCVRALFPHQRQWPCWYLQRHNSRQVEF